MQGRWEISVADNTIKLFDIPDIRRFFHLNETPIYFISATNFNLLGMDEWCRNFEFPVYSKVGANDYLQSLGPLTMPARSDSDNARGNERIEGDFADPAT